MFLKDFYNHSLMLCDMQYTQNNKFLLMPFLIPLKGLRGPLKAL
jgi:hypothetical protein